MHSFLRAVGYSSIEHQKDVEELIADTITNAQECEKYIREDKTGMVEFSRLITSMCGVKVFGEEDSEGHFHMSGYFPYCNGFDHTENKEDDIYINKQVSGEGYTGMCDDSRLGISLIFGINNPVTYFEKYGGAKCISDKPLTISALAQTGKIILPTLVRSENEEQYKKDINKKNKLIAEAKKGNQEAIENLTIEDIDRYAMVSQRIKNEDILSIVDTSLVPYGSESDMYVLTGIIESILPEENKETGEIIIQMIVRCNEIPMTVVVNQKDMLGEPQVGRRFRGNVWLQAKLG